MPAHTGLTILDCRKRNRRHWMSQNWRAVWIFEWFKPLFNKCFERSTVERIEENSNDVSSCFFLYDYVHKFGHGEMRNKKLKIEKKTTLHKNGSSALLNIALEKEGEEKKKKSYYNTGYSYLVTHPSTIPAQQDLTLLSRRNMLLFWGTKSWK